MMSPVTVESILQDRLNIPALFQLQELLGR